MHDQISRLFEESVELNFELYNSLFLTLPLDAVQQTGHLLPLLSQTCHRGLDQHMSPYEIISAFFERHKPGFSEQEQIRFLFRVIQYVERQVVLIDALEDAAYARIHRTEGRNSLLQLFERAASDGHEEKLENLLDEFGVRVVLTAHPTQFYPGPVLAIISDLTRAIARGRTNVVRDLLQQLGNTPFFQKQKPSPYDEAVLLTWYLSNVFYPSAGEIVDNIAQSCPESLERNHGLISIGFWPGGDRDGNPYVTVDTTLRVASRLRSSVLNCYHRDLRSLKRRLSFEGIYEKLDAMEKRLHREMYREDGEPELHLAELLELIGEIEERLRRDYQSLYLDELLSFRHKVQMFGFHFASLDLRQDSRVIHRALQALAGRNRGVLPENLDEMEEAEQISALLTVTGGCDAEGFDDSVLQDTLESASIVREIQQRNGDRGMHRYIISNCRGPVDIARVMAMFRLCGGSETVPVDVVPLFETIADLREAGEAMRRLFSHEAYREHLMRRGGRQTVMLGFSDGTKDGGYLMANWAIYSAKEAVTTVAREAGIEVVFFDGRGGPPARGGGDTFLFYAALGRSIESSQIQTTVQGQTISSHYGHRQAAVHNLGELLAAGLDNNLYDRPERELNDSQRTLMQDLAERSYRAYSDFREHPLFVPYLEEMSTLKYYGMANIGSRPVKRGDDSRLVLEDLRAIPFVGAWSQLKQNVPGFYGLGTALKEQEDHGRLDACLELYQRSRFFRALIANSMQSMSKTNFALTRYMRSDPRFGEFWEMIHDEYCLSREMVLKVAGQEELLEDNARSRLSIGLRERVVLPLLVIQQYALMRIQQCREEGDDTRLETYEKMVMRSLFGNINASRNAA